MRPKTSARRLTEIREIFLNHPAVEVGKPTFSKGKSTARVWSSSSEERQFSQRRMDQRSRSSRKAATLGKAVRPRCSRLTAEIIFTFC